MIAEKEPQNITDLYFIAPLYSSGILAHIARLAQLVEHHIDIVGVAGSSPAPRTNDYP